ncbi:MAG TPA: tyrosine-type recombinase/integrase [Pyrinomonadaceae bacterium]|nr:tyrosine-type recombinase/integrase [Pyrinomonadaceae bacterium]
MADQSLVRGRLTPAETQAIRMVLDGLPSEHSRRAYERALSDFFLWHRGVGRPHLSKAVVQRYAAELRDAGMAPSSVNQRLSAIRKLAAEAADNGALDPQVANGIRAVKGARREGRRTGNWLTREEAQSWLGAPDRRTMRGRRDRALLALLIGCGLRRSEAAGLTFGHIQQRDGRWVLVDLIGKRDKIRSVPMPNWAKAAIDEWSRASGVAEGLVFRAVNKGDRVTGDGITPQAIYNIIVRYAGELKKAGVAPHDLRRTFAKLAHKGGAAIDQIQLSLGHESIQTTEEYLGVEQDLTDAPCDHLGLRLGS